MSSFTYLLASLAFVTLFGLLFLCRPDGQRAMWSTGLTMAPMGPLSQYWHMKDYWEPIHVLRWIVGAWRFGIEDLLFAFAFSGTSAGLFMWLVEGRSKRPSILPTGRISPARMALWVALLLGLLSLGTDGFGWNSLYGINFAFVVPTVWFLYRQPAYVFPASLVGAIAASGMWVFYLAIFNPLFPGVFSEWWKQEALTGIELLGVPIEEPVWAFFGGVFCSLLYPNLLIPQKEDRSSDW